MKEFVAAIAAHGESFRWIFFLALLWVFYRVVENADEVDWIEFITTKGTDDKLHPDWDKVGKGTAVIVGAWAIVAIAPNVKSDFLGFSALLFTFFTFAGAIGGWAAYLRTKQGMRETTTTNEPAPTPTPSKTTTRTVEPATPAPTDKPLKVELAAGPGVEEPMKTQEQGKP